MKTKTINAVDVKRHGALVIYEILARLTPQQQLAFWQERTQALREQQYVSLEAETSRVKEPETTISAKLPL